MAGVKLYKMTIKKCCEKILDLDISGSMTCTVRFGQYLPFLNKIYLVQRLTHCISSQVSVLLLFILRGRGHTNK